jgi:hypothetical protein
VSTIKPPKYTERDKTHVFAHVYDLIYCQDYNEISPQLALQARFFADLLA